MTKIKICGLMREEDIAAVNAFRPDYAGFILAPSRRRITREQAEQFSAMLAPEICPVGVFVDEEPDVILSYVKSGVIRAVQLHGHETVEETARLKTRLSEFHVPLIRAVRMERRDDLTPWLSAPVDFLLLDAGSGGTGTKFDHSLIAGPDAVPIPWFLAGGMTPDNAAKAAQKLRPYAVDVSSGVETDGKKDPEKIRRMIEEIRGLTKR